MILITEASKKKGGIFFLNNAYQALNYQTLINIRYHSYKDFKGFY